MEEVLNGAITVRRAFGRRQVLLQSLLAWCAAAAVSANLTPAWALENSGETATNRAPAMAAEDPAPEAAKQSQAASTDRSKHGYRKSDEVVIGSNVEIAENETLDSLTVVGGSAVVRGKVRHDVVVVAGDLEVQGKVGGDAGVYLGSMVVRSNAVIDRDVIAIGGKVTVEDGDSIRGQVHPVKFGFLEPPPWLASWFQQCLLKLRPLAPGVAWVWWVAGIIWVFYLFIALVLRRPVQACVTELTERPATSFFMGLLTKLLLPVIIVILAAVVLGMVIIPFLAAAVLLAAIFGKVAVFEWIGIRLGRAVSVQFLQQPLIAFTLGSIIVMALYMVPVLGLLTFGVLGMWGVGAAVTAAFGGLRREMPEKRVAAPAPVFPAAGSGTAAGSTVSQSTTPFTAGLTPGVDQNVVPPIIPEALGSPYAGFWERLGAAFLDVVMLGVVSLLTGGHLGPFIALAYFAAMWTWKGTTLGGSLLGLKVVRQDGQPLTFAVAFVRSLAAGLSIVVLFLGFFWIAWDRDKQGWHDKIAGTVVVKLPRGVPLVLL